MIDIQITAADVVGASLNGQNLDRALESTFKRQTTLPREARAAVQSISFDTLRHYGLLAAQLDILLSAPLADQRVRHLLLITLAQLQFSKTKPHVIVDHAVTACETMGFARAKGLVNGVLRNFLREPEKFKRERFKSEIARFDFQAWWIDRVKQIYPNDWEEMLLSAGNHPPMCLRVNRRQTSDADYLALLASVGKSAEIIGEHTILLTEPCGVDSLPKFREGAVSVQDAGAQQAALLLDIKAGMKILDACAAPGGKTGHLLEIADIKLTAIDSDAKRMLRVKQNLDRLKLKAEMKVADVGAVADWFTGEPFDRILLDVPCSASGVVRRHPDIKWLRRVDDIKKFAAQQRRLLPAAWKALRVGGKLLYATCSIFPEENETIIAEFLALHADANQLSVTQLMPNATHDGFFYALLEKH